MLNHMIVLWGFPGNSDGKEFACNIGETWVQSLAWDDPLEMGTITYSSFPAWRIPWTEEPGRLQSIVSQKVRQLGKNPLEGME